MLTPPVIITRIHSPTTWETETLFISYIYIYFFFSNVIIFINRQLAKCPEHETVAKMIYDKKIFCTYSSKISQLLSIMFFCRSRWICCVLHTHCWSRPFWFESHDSRSIVSSFLIKADSRYLVDSPLYFIVHFVSIIWSLIGPQRIN